MNEYLDHPEPTETSLIDGRYFRRPRSDGRGRLHLRRRRKDGMIISGGENIYLTEIENVVLQHENVDDVAVVDIEHEEWGETPKVYVVPNDDSPYREALEGRCRESSLADYTRPREIVIVSDIPRNPNGGSVLKEELQELE